MKKIPVLLLGCGGVGRHLLHHIVSCRSLHANQVKIPLFFYQCFLVLLLFLHSVSEFTNSGVIEVSVYETYLRLDIFFVGDS